MSLSAFVALALAAAPEPFKIATLQLEGSGVPAEMVETATILVPTEVRRARPDAQVMSADDVRSLLLHQKSKVVAGACGNESCMFDLGGALGADEIVAGRLGRLGETWVLELRRVDVKKVRSLGSATRAVRSAEGLVEAVRSAAGELYAPPPGQVAAGAAGGGGGHGIEVKAAQPSDASLPKPSLVEEDLEFHPIRYRGTRHRAVYDLVKKLLVEARVPIEQERLGDDSSLRLRSGWVSIERGRRLRFKVRVDGRVGFDVDREQCDDTGCAEASNTSKGERKLAGDLYGVLRAEVEKGF